VRVNRTVVDQLGAKADPEKDVIEVDGRNITSKGPRIYILLNKPKGYISAISDPLKRPVVTDLVGEISSRIFPVGRLDFDAEGVLLLSNDGEFSNRLIHPRFDVPKKYLVKVKDVPEKSDLEKLEKGVYLEDGKTRPARARFIRKTQENSWIELTVFEGRNRLVKRMCMAVGHPVAKLKRIEFAGIKLGSLKPGEFRLLTKKEIEALKGLGKKEPGKKR
jgi:23S rRNA pseudouridine2605 synthase